LYKIPDIYLLRRRGPILLRFWVFALLRELSGWLPAICTMIISS
jgi:hypothetical protein